MPSDAGTICNIQATHGSPTSSTSFTDNESAGRDDDFWTISDEGKIFFKQNYPYYEYHSIRVTYVRGKSRVPAEIHEAMLTYVVIIRRVMDNLPYECTWQTESEI